MAPKKPMVPNGRYIGTRKGGDPAYESEHYMRCPACLQIFEMRDEF